MRLWSIPFIAHGRNAAEMGFAGNQAIGFELLYTKIFAIVFYLVYQFFTCPLGFQQQEDRFMNALSLKVAVGLVNGALAAGRKICAAPLTVVVLDAGGHLLTLQREDGASLLRPQVAMGKAWGAIALGKGSRLLALDAQQRPAFFAALNGLGQSPVVPAPGGVLIRNEAGVVLGAIGISGDTSDIDEQCAISAIEEAGLRADAGVAA